MKQQANGAMACSALALSAMLLTLGSSPAGAAGIDGTGAAGTCPNTGLILLKPALTNTDNGPATVKVKTKSSGSCTGGAGDGANIVKSTSKGSGTTPSSSCTGLVGPSSTALTITIKWKSARGTPKLNPSTVTITSTTGGVTTDGHASFDATGTVTAGSFNGATVTSHIETDQGVTDVADLCAGKGIKKLTFGLNGQSTTTIN